MKSYPIKYLLFFLPFVAVVCIELFFLPIHQFTFRVWESLAVKRSFSVLRGQFYPNIETRKLEDGDLAYYTPCAIKKDVFWLTDRYGYRKRDTGIKQHPIVIVGDSNIAGSSLSQEELLSEVLEARLGVSVYPLAGERIRALFQHDFLRKNPPRIVILSIIERDIPNGMPPLKPKDFKASSPLDGVVEALRYNRTVQVAATSMDRLFKGNMLHYLRARINQSSPSLRRVSGGSECPIFFLQGKAANTPASAQRIEAAALRLQEYSDVLKKRGIRFIFLPIPNKETIHYSYLNTERPDFLERLCTRLLELDIEVINTQKAFEEFYQKTNSPLHHPDDTHWNGLGVRLAAELLEKAIVQKSTSMYR